MTSALTFEDFFVAATDFINISDSIGDGWKLIQNTKDMPKSYIKKEAFINCDIDEPCILKAEYIIHYNISYRVPSFSFNVWNCSGRLLTLEEIRKMSFTKVDKQNFYTIITQQEHPLFFRPYFIVHPCHTETLLATFKKISKNIIVTFLSLITPLIKMNLPLEYGLSDDKKKNLKE